MQVPGCIFEFGTWLGGSTVVFENLRASHELYNHLRRIHTFDTFDGYMGLEWTGVTSKVSQEILDADTYVTPKSYELYLEQLLDYHESENVMSHIHKHSIHKGNVMETLPKLLDSEPSTIVALAYFDLAAYLPTLSALQLVPPKMIKGSIIVLD